MRLQGDFGPALLRWHAQHAVMSVAHASRVAAVASLALLAGCSLFSKKDARACPRFEIVGDLSRLAKFQEGPGRDLSNVLYMARFDDVKVSCKYDDTGVTVDMTVSLVGERGRAGDKLPNAEVTYLVAIMDGKREIVKEERFTSLFDFSNNKLAAINDELVERIPLPPTAPGSDHTLIIGFQLTPEEIDFNEKNRVR